MSSGSAPSGESPALVSLAVHLTPDQIEWLSEQATRHDVSTDHVVRRLINRARAGSSSDASPPASASGSEDTREASLDVEDDDTALGRLRQAQERIRDLAGIDGSAADASPPSDESDADDPPSMFEIAGDEP